MKQFKSYSFTFTELLVVVAVLVILISLLQPALQRTLWGAKHTHCMTNLKLVYKGFALYYEDNNLLKPWAVSNGTMDGPHEATANRNNGNPGNPAKVLVYQNELVEPENLFCPLSQLNSETHYHQNARNQNRVNGKANFWSSYPYLYKNHRKGVLMGDTQIAVWESFERAYNIDYPTPFRHHYNILNEDGTVVFLTDIDLDYLNYFPDAMVGK